MTIDEIKSLKYLTYDILKSSDVWSLATPYISLNLSNPRQMLYHIDHQITSMPLCFCGNKLSWHTDKRQYRSFCSKKCTAIGSVAQAKQTSLQKYGKEHYSQTDDYLKKVKSTSMERFGVDHYSQTEEYKSRVVTTNMKNFGVAYPSQNKEVQLKLVTSYLKKYGVNNPMQNTDVKAKVILSNKKIGYDKLLSYRPLLTPLFTQSEYTKAMGDNNEFKWQCKNCNLEFVADVAFTLRRGCTACNPITSTWGEQIIAKWLEEWGIEFATNNKSIIKPYELDFFVQDANIAIEFNGTYWHSEKASRGSKYHVNKFKMCQEAGIKLIQIFEHELMINEELIKQRLMHVFGRTNNRIAARKLKVITLSANDSNIFFQKNHLQGCIPAKIHYGLVDSVGTIYAAMSFVKPRYSKKLAEWEMARFASISGWSVIGGAQKLLSAFIKQYTPISIVSYADLKWGVGNVYEKLNFSFKHYSSPNYWYFKDILDIKSRVAYQKHKLPKDLHHLGSEWEIMQHLGWNRFWDCGNAVWVWSKFHVT
jgi:very-short-patch-repair endonuclease